MITIVHLSDLHYREHWDEEQGVVLERFFEDLARQIRPEERGRTYLVFSGDVVQAGGRPELYEAMHKHFSERLESMGILPAHRICVPGNHDLSVDMVRAERVEHEGVVAQMLDEKIFNDYIARPGSLLARKFDNYARFESGFSAYGIAATRTGAGWMLDGDIGVYCVNSALCSSGGLDGMRDKGRLCIDTRSVHKWLRESKASVRILVMHHPISWLSEWAQREMATVMRNSFSLCLSGHVHEQSVFHSFAKGAA